MDISQKLDPIYYKNRYHLSLTSRESIDHHYQKIGSAKGYFANADRERFYLQTTNFDPEYYKRKYNVVGTDTDIMHHWKKHGFKKRNHVNKCEEDMAHHPFMCRCKIVSDKKKYLIKNPNYDSLYSIDNSTLRDTIHDPIMTEKNRYAFTDKADEGLTEDASCDCTKCQNNSTPSDSPTPSEIKMQRDIQFNLKNKVVDQSVMPEYSECTDEINGPYTANTTYRSKPVDTVEEASIPGEIAVQIVTNENGDASIHGLSNLPADLREQIERDLHEQIDSIGQIKNDDDDQTQITESDKQYFDYSFCSQCDNRDVEQNDIQNTESVSESVKEYKSPESKSPESKSHKSESPESKSPEPKSPEPKSPEPKSESDSESEDTEWSKETADTGVFGNMFGKIGQIGQTLSHIFGADQSEKDTLTQLTDTNVTHNSDPSVIEVEHVHYVDDESIYTTAVDNGRDDEEHEEHECDLDSKSVCDCSVCYNNTDTDAGNVLCTECERAEDDSVGTCICGDSIVGLDRVDLIDRVIKNMDEIDSYLKACHIHLDTIITIMKDVFIALQKTLIPSKNSNNLEYDAARMRIKDLLSEVEQLTRTVRHHDHPIFADSKSRSKYIRFPMFYVGRSNVAEINSIFPNRQQYFTMELVKLSLRDLRLKRYVFPLLQIGERMTPYSNPMPASQSDFSREPNKSEYSDPRLARCWNEEYHLKRFERAIHRIVMVKEALDRMSKIVSYRRTECVKYKSL
jgi:hypothetical protein